MPASTAATPSGLSRLPSGDPAVFLRCSLPCESSAFILCSLLEAADESPVNLAPNISAGKYLFHAAGGCSCHSDTKNNSAFLAGGRPIETPFGTFYGTNITPDPETGIGNWSDEDFIRAMTQGLSPEGNHYFPVFPYTSFQRINRKDLLALKAYLFSLPPVRQNNLSVSYTHLTLPTSDLV